MADILIVDDDRVIRESYMTLLEGEGHTVRTAPDGEIALRKISEKRPDLVLLDVMMQKLSGIGTCKEIRKCDPLLPIVFLTALDSEVDEVRGMAVGGDDYVSKAAGEAVLLARIERALERVRQMDAHAGRHGDETVRLGPVTVDLRRLTVTDSGDEIARLTPSEAGILRLLDTERERPFSRDEIITELRGAGFACEDSMVYMHVSNLRRKLGAAAEKVRCVRGAGYSLAR